MKTLPALLLVFGTLASGTAAQAGATQAPAHRVVSPSSRYWLSDDLNRLVFWQVRTAAQRPATSVEAASVEDAPH